MFEQNLFDKISYSFDKKQQNLLGIDSKMIQNSIKKRPVKV